MAGGRSNSSDIDAATHAGIVPLQTMATPTHDTPVRIINFHYSNQPSCFLISDTNKETKHANILSWQVPEEISLPSVAG